MCGCGKKNPIYTYRPLYRQVISKDRLGRTVILKVPLNPPRRKIMKKNIQQPISLEKEIDSVLRK